MATAAHRSLLVELLVEELPPKALKKLGEAFADGIVAGLAKSGLLGTSGARVEAFASPRRLAVHVQHVLSRAVDQPHSRKLMPVAVGLDANGQPTASLMKRLLGLNVGAEVVPMLRRQLDGKTEALYFDSITAGAALDEGLQTALDETLAGLPIPKLMSYQLDDGWTSVNFVRPVHGLVALHGDAVVQCYALGIGSGRATQGHRFEASKSPIELTDADSYAEQLEREGAVIASFAARRSELEGQLKATAAREGLALIDDHDALLDEVCALVERPNVLLCEFEREFLEVPSECLVLTMQANQKYFPLLDGDGQLTNRFLVASNIRPADPSRIVEGNERVVRPRLADAKFFFDQDRKKKLESRVQGLAKVIYHAQLGTLGDRVKRVRAISLAIGAMLGGEALAQRADQAAKLAKADLLTDMVGEFPELQGTMGGYYARHEGLPDEIAFAIEDHYKPRFAGDELPRNEIGIVVALADKLETLLGMFKIDEVPTGDKDPYALRRHALGVLRMCMERNLRVPLDKLVDEAGKAWETAKAAAESDQRLDQARKGVTVQPNIALLQESISRQKEKARQSLLGFMRDRLAVTLRDQGFSANEIDAVLSVGPLIVADIPKRLAAVRSFGALPESSSLAAANKRIVNILKKSDGKPAATVDEQLLLEPAERALAATLRRVRPTTDSLFDDGEYAASLRELAILKAPVDAFFDSVMVNADDPALRANRLGLLAMLQAAMNRVADLSKLAV